VTEKWKLGFCSFSYSFTRSFLEARLVGRKIKIKIKRTRRIVRG